MKANPWESLLKHVRLRLQMTLKDTAKELGAAVSIVSRVEGRIKPCPLALAFKYAELFGCELTDIFNRDGFAKRFDDTKFFSDNGREIIHMPILTAKDLSHK